MKNKEGSKRANVLPDYLNKRTDTDSWMERLEKLGLTRKKTEKKFYTKATAQTLFGEETNIVKILNTVKISAEIYKERLKEVFKLFLPYELRNSQNSVMYHLFLASNNKTAVKIGNDIVKKYNN
ncbi:MAG: hypothetical protein IPG78_11440 [Ignavibacteria bacterium]|nr:hypothetical protein [Ignavibacteria bacterium]